jgi:hypothetical protein
MESPVEKFCRMQGYKLAQTIDDKMAIVIRPRPRWCPDWLYKKIIKASVEIVTVQN